MDNLKIREFQEQMELTIILRLMRADVLAKKLDALRQLDNIINNVRRADMEKAALAAQQAAGAPVSPNQVNIALTGVGLAQWLVANNVIASILQSLQPPPTIDAPSCPLPCSSDECRAKVEVVDRQASGPEPASFRRCPSPASSPASASFQRCPFLPPTVFEC
jgi:hypothetical protein